MNNSIMLGLGAIVLLAGIGFLAYNSSPAGNTLTPSPSPSTPTPVAQGGCFVGGCSSQLCSDQEGAMSTCEYRAEYACYQSAKCERQASGQCGWTETSQLQACLTANVNANLGDK